MENIYLAVIILLFAFAIFDLMVGVSNDAANFLNSAIGSKVTSKKNIFIVASLGILAGAVFSSGMMEVARKGIFHPDQFVFAEIIVIFLSVMITDIILLDVYNTFRLPTSTTVSIVFELLWAAVAVSLFKIYQAGDGVSTLMTYINSEKALLIISWILLSVVVAFSVWAIIQRIVRLVFTFKYTKKFKYYGAIWWWIAVTAITYFLLIKGLKGTALAGSDQLIWIKEHTTLLLCLMLVGWTLILYICNRLRKINILKVIVLVGTFSLAMAFAGNDLVNFIWVPIAAYNAFQLFVWSGVDPSALLMTGLTGKVPTPFLFLVLAGGVMVATLWFSKKSQSVRETEIGLARVSVWNESFKSSSASRALVGSVLGAGGFITKVVPERLTKRVKSRFERESTSYKKDAPAFDLIRASVNLTVASVLIAIATSMKLPLSTTYVTFMVAMGTTLADGVWGRDSAVYRITWVLTVVGGWFLTAISAFFASALVATIIYFGGFIAIIAMVFLTVFIVYKTNTHHKKTSAKKEEHTKLYANDTSDDLTIKVSYHAQDILTKAEHIFHDTIQGIIHEKKSELKKQYVTAEELRDETAVLKSTIHDTFKELWESQLASSHYYVKAIMYLRKLSRTVRDIAEDAQTYVENHHPSLVDTQVKELHKIQDTIKICTHACSKIIEDNDFGKVDEFERVCMTHEEHLAVYKKEQLGRIKSNKVGVRNSTLYLSLLAETENYLIYIRKMLKAYKGLQEK